MLTRKGNMPFSEVSLLLLAVLMVAIQAQWIPADGVTFLGQTRLQSGTQLQTGIPLINLGLSRSSSGTSGVTQENSFQHLQSDPFQSNTASSISTGSIPIVDPELLGPNEGIGHDSPLQFQNVFTTENGISTGTVSDRDDPPGSPYSFPGRTSPLRGPNGEMFRITGDVVLPLIVPNRFNRLPRLGGNGDAVTSSGEYINTLAPRPRRRRGPRRQFGPSFWPDH
ncbi:hypothetical protein CHS0354_028385 [Potamilus streckersoni]|uniref:Uncharacterized protein n=1 Tax=Potamilus streckersoni TaxID=2493646 RepID=A0AAE0RTX2_9BIVA|nr:hypothetical protein CHS0354_028385 [Potamilus streckersoni]